MNWLISFYLPITDELRFRSGDRKLEKIKGCTGYRTSDSFLYKIKGVDLILILWIFKFNFIEYLGAKLRGKKIHLKNTNYSVKRLKFKFLDWFINSLQRSDSSSVLKIEDFPTFVQPKNIQVFSWIDDVIF